MPLAGSRIVLSMLKMLQFGLDPQRELRLPTRPNIWGSRDSSNRGANSQSNSSSQGIAAGPRQGRTGRRPPPRASREEEPTSRQLNPEGVGRNLFDSFGVPELGGL
ncbi:hypothetical protein THAOC_10213 [Thalassiosira oceanica]|uniref:Uncharacterized protein n=1 Tax=Thalassiosira oceanica TaxID=159749 RepID=K0SUH8_THAOC|nr:hypothetical protein THAOC_10213 [Thalassiosira oceanica]|eukprot:EJK68594.1 hypothetical protein THAOC_10213 [Thalassiosira oceanica]